MYKNTLTIIYHADCYYYNTPDDKYLCSLCTGEQERHQLRRLNNKMM